MSKPKPETRAERQAKLDDRNKKLDQHINQGVQEYVQNHYNDNKEARKNARWYQTGEALVEAKLKAQHDADVEFLEEFNIWAEKKQEAFYAELDSNEQAMLMANDDDDVIEVEYKEIAPKRRERKSLLGGTRPSLGSSSSEIKSLNPATSGEARTATHDVKNAAHSSQMNAGGITTNKEVKDNPFQSSKRPK